MFKRVDTYKNVTVGNLTCIQDDGPTTGHNRILQIQCNNCGNVFHLRPYQFLRQEHTCATNYVGLSNGVLTCIEDLGMKDVKGKKHHMLKAKCSRCGSTTEIRAERITSNTYTPQSCSNCVNSLYKEIADNKFAKTRKFRRRYHSILGNAKGRGIKVSLTEEQIADILKQECYYCGKPNADGIDRVDSTKDYTIDNVVPCCGICNRMKNKYSLSTFLDRVYKIYNRFFTKSSTTIPKGSTLQANGSGSGRCPEVGNDIV